jgi:Spy/CpxP family protein refolding chaperone
MKKGLSILAGLLALGIMTMPLSSAEGVAEAQDKGKAKRDRKPVKRGEGEPFSQAPAFGEDLEALATKVGLSDDQKTKLQKLKEARDAELAKYDKANEPRVQKAQERLNQLTGKGEGDKAKQIQSMRKQLEGFLKGVEAGRERLASGHDRKMFAVLTPEQRVKWNGPILKDAMTKEFSLLFLDTKQEERLEAFCNTQAKRLNLPLDPDKHAKSLEGLHLQVYRTILNKKQQAEYLKMRSSTEKKGKDEGRGKRGG